MPAQYLLPCFIFVDTFLQHSSSGQQSSYRPRPLSACCPPSFPLLPVVAIAACIVLFSTFTWHCCCCCCCCVKRFIKCQAGDGDGDGKGQQPERHENSRKNNNRCSRRRRRRQSSSSSRSCKLQVFEINGNY